MSVLPNERAAYRRTRTLITVPTNKVDTPEWQVFIIDPQDLEAALSRDADEAAPQQGEISSRRPTLTSRSCLRHLLARRLASAYFCYCNETRCERRHFTLDVSAVQTSSGIGVHLASRLLGSANVSKWSWGADICLRHMNDGGLDQVWCRSSLGLPARRERQSHGKRSKAIVWDRVPSVVMIFVLGRD